MLFWLQDKNFQTFLDPRAYSELIDASLLGAHPGSPPCFHVLESLVAKTVGYVSYIKLQLVVFNLILSVTGLQSVLFHEIVNEHGKKRCFVHKFWWHWSTREIAHNVTKEILVICNLERFEVSLQVFEQELLDSNTNMCCIANSNEKLASIGILNYGTFSVLPNSRSHKIKCLNYFLPSIIHL